MEMPEKQSATAGAGKQGFLLQGKWTTSEKTYPLRNSYDGSLLAKVCNADPSQVEQALGAGSHRRQRFPDRGLFLKPARLARK